jgi:heterodisulfide reductase subunit A
MAVAKVSLLEPLTDPVLEMNQTALVIGGGVAGMIASKTLADQGYKTLLIEKGDSLGGQARFVHETWRGENVQEFLTHLIQEIRSHENIEVFVNSQISQVDGFVGHFKTSIDQGGETRVLEHGVTIIASGASELKPDQYLYGEDPRVITGMELQQRFIQGDSSLTSLRSAVFIQCVGSRIPERPYCSKICCTSSIKSALTLKEMNPHIKIFIVYRDMRPYGLREDLYREARSKGISFVRYDFEQDLNVTKEQQSVFIHFTDVVLRRQIQIQSDMLVLATAVVPERESPLATLYKIPQDADGFFLEAHAKLRPVDFATDGVFLCGLAHSAKPIDEAIAQAQAAAARAVALLAAKTIHVSGTVAVVNPFSCSSCGICVSVCPYSAPRFNEKTGKAEIEPTLCKGCGLCSASCRSGAIGLRGFEPGQIMDMISGA